MDNQKLRETLEGINETLVYCSDCTHRPKEGVCDHEGILCPAEVDQAILKIQPLIDEEVDKRVSSIENNLWEHMRPIWQRQAKQEVAREIFKYTHQHNGEWSFSPKKFAEFMDYLKPEKRDK